MATQRIIDFLATRRPDGPCLVVDLDVVADNFRAFERALPDSKIYYAIKANPASEILRLLARMGSSFDAASVAEVEMAMNAGAPASRISFGNTIKKERDIARAYQLGDDAQAAYAAALRHDPDGLESRLLHDIAVAFARHRCPQLGWSGLLRRAAALAYLSCERLYGADRWPLPALRLSYWRYTRRRKRVQRGLAPKPGQGHR